MAQVRIDMILQDLNNSIGRRTQAVQNLNRQLQTTQNLSQTALGGGTPSGGQLTQYNQARATGAGTTGAAGRDFAAQAQGLGGVVRLYATFAANIFAVSSAFSALQQAANFERMIQGSKLMSIQVGTNIGKLGQDLQAATGYAISFEQAMQFANLGTSAGIAAKQMTSLVTIARGAAVGLGRDVEDSVRRVIQGTAKQEQEILDELGIFIKAQKAYDEYAKKFNISGGADALSAQQRVQAYADAVEKAGEKWKEFATVEDPFSRFIAQGKQAVQVILEFVNQGVKPILDYLSGSRDAIIGIIALIAGTLTMRALPELKGVFDNVFFFNKQKNAAQAEALRSQIRSEIATTANLISTAQARLAATSAATFGQAQLAAAFSGTNMLVPGGSGGVSLQRLTTNLLGTANRPVDLARYQSVADVEKQILNTIRAQVGTKQQVLDNMIRIGAVERTSNLQNIQLSGQNRQIAQAIFAQIQQQNAALQAQANLRTQINNLTATQATLQTRLSNVTSPTGQPVQRIYGGQNVGPQQPGSIASFVQSTPVLNSTAIAAANVGRAVGEAASNFSKGVQAIALSTGRMADVVDRGAITKLGAFKNVLLDNISIIRNAGSAMAMLGAAFSTLGFLVGSAIKGIMALAGPLLIAYSLWEIFKDKLLPESYKRTKELEQATKSASDAFLLSASSLERNIAVYEKSNKSSQDYLNFVQSTNNAIRSQIEALDDLVKARDRLTNQEALSKAQEQARQQGLPVPTQQSMALRRAIEARRDLLTPEQITRGEDIARRLEGQQNIAQIQQLSRSQIDEIRDRVLTEFEPRFQDFIRRLKETQVGGETPAWIKALDEQGLRQRALANYNLEIQQRIREEIDKTTKIAPIKLGDVSQEARDFNELLLRLGQQAEATANTINSSFTDASKALDKLGKDLKGKVQTASQIASTPESQSVAKFFETIAGKDIRGQAKTAAPAFESLKALLEDMSGKGIPEAKELLGTLMAAPQGESGAVQALELFNNRGEQQAKIIRRLNVLTGNYTLEALGGFKGLEDRVARYNLELMRSDKIMAKEMPGIERQKGLRGYYSTEESSRILELEQSRADIARNAALAEAQLARDRVLQDKSKNAEDKALATQQYSNTLKRINLERDISDEKSIQSNIAREIEAAVYKQSIINKQDLDTINYISQQKQLELDLEKAIFDQKKSLGVLTDKEIADGEYLLGVGRAALEYERDRQTAIQTFQNNIRTLRASGASDTTIAERVSTELGPELTRALDAAKGRYNVNAKILDLVREEARIQNLITREVKAQEQSYALRQIQMSTQRDLRQVELQKLDRELEYGNISQDQYDQRKRQIERIGREEEYRSKVLEVQNKYMQEQVSLNTRLMESGDSLQLAQDQANLDARRAAELEGLARVKAAQDDYNNSIRITTERQRAYADAVANTFNQLGDHIAVWAKEGKWHGKDLFNSLIADLLRFELQLQLSQMWKLMRPGFQSFIGSLFGPTNTLAAQGTFGTPGTIGDTLYPMAKGGIVDYSGIQKFGKGGMFTNSIVSNPTIFKFAKGIGMMGEAGPEAIMPLKRDNQGNLGVRADKTKVDVVVNNYSGEKATTQELQDSRGNRRIEVTIGEMTAGEISRSGSSSQKAIKGTFGISPQLIRR